MAPALSNLRATRQTELAECFPAHVVCAWIGNTERVAQNHYLQVTDAHFAQGVVEPVKREATAGAAQNPAQSESVSVGKNVEPGKSTNQNRSDLPSDSEHSRCLLNDQVAATGLEPVTRGL